MLPYDTQRVLPTLIYQLCSAPHTKIAGNTRGLPSLRPAGGVPAGLEAAGCYRKGPEPEVQLPSPPPHSMPLSGSAGKLQLKFQPALSHCWALLLQQKRGKPGEPFSEAKKKKTKNNFGGGREGRGKEAKPHGDGFCASGGAREGAGSSPNTPEQLSVICNREED